jgi:hypothetical protein
VKKLLIVPALILPMIAYAQMASIPPRSVGVIVPDGGLLVTGAVRATIELPDGGTQVVQIEGRNGGPILTTIDGTPVFSLSSESLASIAAPTCTIVGAPPVITLTTTPVNVPTTPLTDRTQLIVKNLSTNQNVWCCVGVACSPTSTAAYVILPNGDNQGLPVRASDTVRCRSAAATAAINAQEASCV